MSLSIEDVRCAPHVFLAILSDCVLSGKVIFTKSTAGIGDGYETDLGAAGNKRLRCSLHMTHDANELDHVVNLYLRDIELNKTDKLFVDKSKILISIKGSPHDSLVGSIYSLVSGGYKSIIEATDILGGMLNDRLVEVVTEEPSEYQARITAEAKKKFEERQK